MHAVNTTSLIRRDDTFLGVCQAIGEDFGFNPVYLRIAFAAPMLFAPLAAVAAYFGLGAVVLLSRLLAPRPKRKAAAATGTAPVAAGSVEPQVPLAEADANEEDQLPLPIAA